MKVDDTFFDKITQIFPTLDTSGLKLSMLLKGKTYEIVTRNLRQISKEKRVQFESDQYLSATSELASE